MRHFKFKIFIRTLKSFFISLIVGILFVLSIGLISPLNALAETETDIDKSELVQIEENSVTISNNEVYNVETLTKAMFGDVDIRSSEYLYNLDGSSDFIYVEFENDCGYAIYYKDSMELLEYSAQGSLAYPTTTTLKYYGGPSIYLTKQDNCFVDVLNGETLEITSKSAQEYSDEVRYALNNSYRESNVELDSFDYSDIINANAFIETDTIEYSYLDTNSYNDILKEGDTPPSYSQDGLIRVTDGTYIPNYYYFLSAPLHGQNSTGTCGAVAAQLLLSYNNYYNDRRIIADKYLNGSSSDPEKSPNLCSDPMLMNSYTLGTRGYYEDGSDDENSYFSYIVDIIPKSAYNTQVRDGLKTILNTRNNEISGTIDYTIDYKTGTSSQAINSSYITSEIDSGRPALILMQSSLGGTNHYVIAYGYQNYTYPNTTTSYLGYITHFGWKSSSSENYLNIWVNSSWCHTCISLKINHTHSYSTVGAIGTTGRTEYKCSTCGHRTDAAINMSSSERYVERVATIPNSNAYKYQDYYVTFKTAGNKLFQTFGSGDAKLYLYDTEYNQLAYNDDSGYSLNSLFSYTVTADTPYILRTQFYNSAKTGIIKIGITAADTEYSAYTSIQKSGTYSSISNLSLNTTKVLTYTPTTSGTYTFDLNSTFDNYIYVIDPRSTATVVSNVDYNDDGGSGLNARLSKTLDANVTYLIICSKYNPSTSFSNSDSSILALSITIDGKAPPTPSYLNLELTARSGFIIYNWDVKITNPNSYAVQVTYNSKMCFESDANNYTNLSDLVTIVIPANSSTTVRINGNGTAGWITTCIDYTYGGSNYRRVTCANGLSGSLTMNTPVKNQITYK
jgi:hypothetical protein